MRTIPRFTSAIRAFSEVVPPESETNKDGPNLEEKRRFELENKAKESFSWENFVSVIHDALSEKGQLKEIDHHLKELRNVVREIVGLEFSSRLVDAACIHLFRMFHAVEMVNNHHLQELRLCYGLSCPSLAKRACACICRLVTCIPEDVVDCLLAGKSSNDECLKEYFGKDIKYNEILLPFSEDFYDPDLDAINVTSNIVDNFTFKYEDINNESSVKTSNYKREEKKYDKVWMRQTLEDYFDRNDDTKFSLNELISTILQLLQSEKTNEELQNELFDLLGFDRFELIEIILEKRLKIISDCSRHNGRSSGLHSTKEAANKIPQRPTYGCQITIQSEKEKQLSKQQNKEKKSFRNIVIGDESSSESFHFNPQELRMQRELALISAISKPVLSQRPQLHVEKYPNVFDLYAEAKQSAAYICGTKMTLPVGFERVDNKQWEEIRIPVNESAPAHIGSRLKPIMELDETGQSVFQGLKTLNRIQSIVFDTAYHTNENLLICAPTGAGKTNIALLTIVREIKQHFENGEIKKQAFKIVYVAPMKALASEMVQNFSKRLAPLGIAVREYTGDMQLTKKEITETQIIVTTPEKWDVVTRKGVGDVSLTQLVSLLIFDEVHLLHGNRGPVVEALVARTLRQVESSQRMIRIVGLSATLPNYVDVATFLRVNPYVGLFFFDSRFRPVPLGQTFIGVKAVNPLQQIQDMDTVCYNKVFDFVKQGHQTMVFVHARNATVRTALVLRELANNKGHSTFFEVNQSPAFGTAEKMMMKSRNKQLRELFPSGFSVHHAGMLRHDRNLVEKLFRDGMIKVLVCTSTLAWGVNLPAHAVIIKGTEIYDAKQGNFIDLDILDVLQIFGRAGRPQFDTLGHGTIITSHDKLNHYLSLLTCQYPIESQFTQNLTDNLNAEIVLGTVTNVEEAVKWLSYTYLFVRMKKNPHVYGIPYKTLKDDPNLLEHRRDLIIGAAKLLDKVNMIRFVERAGFLHPTDLGRTASHFYIKYASVETINESLSDVMGEPDILSTVSMAEEFNQLKLREDEMDELESLQNSCCYLPVKGGKENVYGKVNILIQAHISRNKCESFSLNSDLCYVTQNASRIMRALFEIVLRKRWPIMASRMLCLSKCLEQRLWDYENPLHQFSALGPEVLQKLEQKKLTIDKLKEMNSKEIGSFIHHIKMGRVIKKCVEAVPMIIMDASIQPITREILRVKVDITADFRWDDHIHGNSAESFWIWVEDPLSNYMHHSEYFILTKKQVIKKEIQTLVFTIPAADPLPNQYFIRAISDRWLGSETVATLSFENLILPERHPPHTELLDLDPLPITALQNPQLELLYNFSHFNPIQTQVFHTLYHTDENVLIGAPTGSGKTIAAEIAMFRVFRDYPKTKVVYIAPLKALVRERIDDWKIRLERQLGKQVVELTGDVTPDARAISTADVIVTTPEKWDGVSRSWQTRNYVKLVSLIVIDEIHLLGEDRGPVLEVIVSRTNFITSHTDYPLRVIGLSTALANARDLADWLRIQESGLFNFRPSVRPVPLEVHIEGFPGKHYCPRMATMNKPTYQAIVTHSPIKPTLVFVSSRRQTRLTALDLIAFLAAEDNPKQWLHMEEAEMDNIIAGIKDTNLKLTLAFGIGIHHAGLQERDRRTVEELFVNQKIQVLIATATLAWGVNFPAHLVVVKGTEYYDGKTKRYVDFPITDVLQMMGRAGRPQYDDHGVAVVLVHDMKKSFYRKFLYSPFPVESSLLEVLADHLNAEIVAGTITTKQESLDYLTWTYFFRRLIQNPSYYHLEQTDHESINKYLSALIERSLNTLLQSSCITIGEDNRSINYTTLGRIASYYYLHHTTVRTFEEKMTPDLPHEDLLEVLCSTHEYEELPVRHNEDAMNSDLAKNCPLEVNPYTFDSPHTKANLLFQAHFSRLQLPCTDYLTDLKSVLDQAIRILQAMIDVAADHGWLATAIRVINLLQMVLQGCWYKESSLLMLPNVESHHLYCFKRMRRISKMNKFETIDSIPELIEVCKTGFESLAKMIRREFNETEIEQIYQVVCTLPVLDVKISVKGWWENKLEEEEHPVKLSRPVGARSPSDWLAVHADQEYVLNISLNRSCKFRKQDSRAHAPRFPKPKDEGWFLVLGDTENKELLALKRISYISRRTNCQLMFYTPETTGRVIYTLYVLSDSYLGLDQQFDICLDIIPASIEAQVNTEVQLDSSFDDSAEEPISGSVLKE